LFLTLSKLGEVAWFDAPEAGKADGEEVLEQFIQEQLAAADKRFVDDAMPALRELVEPTRRALAGELEKLFLYVGTRRDITAADVRAICSATRQAIIWELVDAVAARQLPRALVALENLLGHGEQPIGVIALLAGQFRLMILARDLADRKVLVPGADDRDKFTYVNAFKKLPATATAHFPRGKDGRLPNEWRFQRCAVAARRFTAAELVRAIEQLVDAQRQLVSTQLDERLVLAETLAHIAGAPRRVR
jgi:DNA polymerase-3 subunit delta